MRHIISLGAGVQSSAMALMAAHGEIEPMPECAIFADTGWEPAKVYQWLDWLERQLPFAVRRVSAGNIRKDNITARVRGRAEDGERWASMPYFTRDAETGEHGMIRRQCTREYKIDPVERFMREVLLGLKPRQRAPKEPVFSQWRGISADEASRMSPSRVKWYETRFPLAMEHRMTRDACLAWMATRGYATPPRSACLGCPFHSDAEWKAIKARPNEWMDVVEFDRSIRKAGGMRGDTFLHADRKPLEDIDFDADRGQADWINECEGMCGV